MSATRHTSGSWTVQGLIGGLPSEDTPITIVVDKDVAIAEVVYDRGDDMEVIAANANLMAAAPKLLETCIAAQERLSKEVETGNPDVGAEALLARLRIAIKTALGDEHAE